ncbi:transposase IS116/IS110/IS902 family protein [Methylophaga lonarensis MPL]|uniref:Transposase IS116/IS110/IS902 family protein n=1 Tax=Methylophaga lonarensis MPL TaxID=1286106 RepID=M7NX37_9GAMM|nr:transposase IS116/IS110/IS902 family protein [Methylophaga lonarensis MPL]
MVAVDAAKYTHKAMICTFYGDILVKPFEFDASLTGIKKIGEYIKSLKKVYKMQEVVVGVETTGHYYEDLVRHCHSEGYHVRILNAATTAKERETLLNWSKTDNLDLMAIVQSLIHGRGTSSELGKGKVFELQKLTRARRELVKEQTDTKNLIRSYIDTYFSRVPRKKHMD